jgi:hypothetical protein
MKVHMIAVAAFMPSHTHLVVHSKPIYWKCSYGLRGRSKNFSFRVREGEIYDGEGTRSQAGSRSLSRHRAAMNCIEYPRSDPRTELHFHDRCAPIVVDGRWAVVVNLGGVLAPFPIALPANLPGRGLRLPPAPKTPRHLWALGRRPR